MKHRYIKRWMLLNIVAIAFLILPLITNSAEMDDKWQLFAVCTSISVALHLTLVLIGQPHRD